MFLISTETGNVADLVLKNKSIDVKNIPPSASIKNDSANGSPQPLSSLSSINLLGLSGISIIPKSRGGSCLGGKTGGNTGIGTRGIGGTIGGGTGGNGGSVGGGTIGGGVNIGKSGNGGGGGGNTG